MTGFRLHEQHTATMGRMLPEHLDELCPDWRERETFASGPGDMLDALTEHFEREERLERLHMERFQPKLDGGETGEGGTIKLPQERLRRRGRRHQADPRLRARRPASSCPSAAARGSATPASGRFAPAGFATCATARSAGQEGETVRTCINAPEGPIEIEL